MQINLKGCIIDVFIKSPCLQMAQPVILLILSLSQVVNIPYMDMHGKLALSV